MRSALAIATCIAVAVLFSGPTNAQDMRRAVKLEINQVYARKLVGDSAARPAVIVTVSNKTGESLAGIEVTCSWLSEGTPVAERSIIVGRLDGGSSRVEEFWADATGVQFDTGRCAVTEARGALR